MIKLELEAAALIRGGGLSLYYRMMQFYPRYRLNYWYIRQRVTVKQTDIVRLTSLGGLSKMADDTH